LANTITVLACQGRKAERMNFDSGHIVRPHQLKSGDTIGIVAPAGPFEEARFSQGIIVIESMGFSVHIDDRIFSRRGYLAGTDMERAAHFNAMVADDNVQALMCARGGYGALRMLDGLNYAAVAAAAKPLIGFSDITALHRAVYLRSGLATFHGPMVVTLAESDEASRRRWYQVLTEPVAPPVTLAAARVLNPGIAEGILVGGNLATLCHLLGTALGSGCRGCIVLLEEIGEPLYRIDRMLVQMKMAGLFEGMAGLVLGCFKNCGPKEDIESLVEEIFRGWDIPIVSGAPIGHGQNNWMVPLGIVVRMDTSQRQLVFIEPTFQE
jgi:muramoyltetrapeptide carboxypeptidase